MPYILKRSANQIKGIWHMKLAEDILMQMKGIRKSQKEFLLIFTNSPCGPNFQKKPPLAKLSLI